MKSYYISKSWNFNTGIWCSIKTKRILQKGVCQTCQIFFSFENYLKFLFFCSWIVCWIKTLGKHLAMCKLKAKHPVDLIFSTECYDTRRFFRNKTDFDPKFPITQLWVRSSVVYLVKRKSVRYIYAKFYYSSSISRFSWSNIHRLYQI